MQTKINEPDSKVEKLDSLKELLGDLSAKIGKLSSYDIEEEVTAYCDCLVNQVTAAIDAAFDHLNKLGNMLFEQINEYRTSVLEKSSVSPLKRFKSSEISLQQEIDELASEIKCFNVNSSTDSGLFKSIQSSISRYQIEIGELERRKKHEVFRDGFIHFKANELFCKLDDHLGIMICEPSTPVDTKNESMSLSPASSDCQSSFGENQQGEALQSLIGHTDKIRQVVFLLDGNLASCSDDKTIKVWDRKSGKLLFELQGSSDKVSAMAPLSTRLLASSSGSSIYIWSLNERKLLKKLRAHEKAIFSLRFLENGSLVSASFDGSIKVWNPYRETDNLLQMMRSHGVNFRSSLAVVANDQVATCSNSRDPSEEGVLKLWLVNKSQYTRLLKVGSSDACSLAGLRNDRVAVGFSSGRLTIFDTQGISAPLSIEKCQLGGVYSLLEAPNGALLSGGSRQDSTVKIWDTRDGRLVQTIQTSHSDNICSLSLSYDARRLATGSHDKTASIIHIDSNFFDQIKIA